MFLFLRGSSWVQIQRDRNNFSLPSCGIKNSGQSLKIPIHFFSRKTPQGDFTPRREGDRYPRHKVKGFPSVA